MLMLKVKTFLTRSSLTHSITHSLIHPPFIPLILFRVRGGPKPIPGDSGSRQTTKPGEVPILGTSMHRITHYRKFGDGN